MNRPRSILLLRALLVVFTCGTTGCDLVDALLEPHAAGSGGDIQDVQVGADGSASGKWSAPDGSIDGSVGERVYDIGGSAPRPGSGGGATVASAGAPRVFGSGGAAPLSHGGFQAFSPRPTLRPVSRGPAGHALPTAPASAYPAPSYPPAGFAAGPRPGTAWTNAGGAMPGAGFSGLTGTPTGMGARPVFGSPVAAGPGGYVSQTAPTTVFGPPGHAQYAGTPGGMGGSPAWTSGSSWPTGGTGYPGGGAVYSGGGAGYSGGGMMGAPIQSNPTVLPTGGGAVGGGGGFGNGGGGFGNGGGTFTPNPTPAPSSSPIGVGAVMNGFAQNGLPGADVANLS